MRFQQLPEEEMKDSSMAPIHGSAPIADRRPDTTNVAPACPHLTQQDFLGLLRRNNMEEEDVRRLPRQCLLKTTLWLLEILVGSPI